MNEPTNQQTVLVSSGDPLFGPYYLVISGLPEYTKWQDIADFLRCRVCPWLDVYVSLNGPMNTSGWIRVIGLEIFAHVERVLRECPFMGQQIIYHDPGYEYTNGFGAIVINGPFIKDQHLFLPMDTLSSVPSPSPTITPAMGDTIWVWSQVTPHGQPAAPPTAFPYSAATPTSPSPLLPPAHWDLASSRYPPVILYQAAPYFHQQPFSYTPHHQIQPQPQQQQIPNPWFPPSPISPEMDQCQQFHNMQQTYPHAQQQNEGLLKLIITWKEPQDFSPPPQAPYAGTYPPPSIPWAIPTASTTTPAVTRNGSRERNSNVSINRKPCTTVHIALSSSKNHPWIMRCSPETVIATFRTPQHALQAFNELSYLEHISVRFPYSNEDLVYLENSRLMRDCTHTPQKWQHQPRCHDQYDHGYRERPDTYSPDKRDTIARQYERPGAAITAPSPRRRRRGIWQPPQLQLLPPLPIRSQKYIPSPPPPPPPPAPTMATTGIKTDHSEKTSYEKPHVQGGERRGSAAVLIVDGSVRRHAQDEAIQRPGSGAIGTSTGNASVLVVNGSVSGTVNNSSRSQNIEHVPGKRQIGN